MATVRETGGITEHESDRFMGWQGSAYMQTVKLGKDLSASSVTMVFLGRPSCCHQAKDTWASERHVGDPGKG